MATGGHDVRHEAIEQGTAMSDRLAEIRARLESMSWVSDEFVAHAPADIAWLLDEVERLRGEA